MAAQRRIAIICDGCRRETVCSYPVQRGAGITKGVAEQVARDSGWQAPDKLGRHWCPECRRSPKPARRG